ncbi:MAG: 3-phosphoserine/phosphohydroxythreonine transaminase, partial [Planctomycetota bacterium]
MSFLAPRVSPRARVLRWMRDQIETGFFRPGDELPGERHVAATVGVSRETVRAAWAQLQQAGLIELTPTGRKRRIPETPAPGTSAPVSGASGGETSGGDTSGGDVSGGETSGGGGGSVAARSDEIRPDQTPATGPSRRQRRRRRRGRARRGEPGPSQPTAPVLPCEAAPASAKPLASTAWPSPPPTLTPPKPSPTMPTATHRVYNFSAGPCTLPLEVLERAQEELTDFRGLGMSVMEMSHRSKPVVAAHEAAIDKLRRAAELPDDFEILLLAGGATFQFGMVPMNLASNGERVDYTHSGAWAKKAIADAKAVGADVNVVFDGTDAKFTTLPDPGDVASSDGSAYLHLTTNETIGGLQWKDIPACEASGGIVADMSSDFLSRPMPWERFGLVYAGAQKNIGPAGVCVVFIRKDVLERCATNHVNYLNYANHAGAGSMLNTPPVFQIYMVGLVMDWLLEQGGLPWAQDMATRRSKLLYDAIATSGGGDFYRCPVDERYRSAMNVVFRLPTEELEAKFIADATAQGMDGLKG